MARGSTAGMSVIQRVNAPSPRGIIDTRNQSREEQAQYFQAGGRKAALTAGTALAGIPVASYAPGDTASEDQAALDRLAMIANHGGNIMDILPPGIAESMGQDAIREWETDKGTRRRWEEVVQKGLLLAEQETDDDEGEKDYPFEGASDVHYPILTTAALQFQSRTLAALIKGDKVAGVKTFEVPGQSPSPLEIAQGTDQPTDPAVAQQQAVQVAAATKAQQQQSLAAQAKEARAKRVGIFLNFQIFYKMDGWEADTDLLLMEMPIAGTGFKKVFKSDDGLHSEYVSAMRLVVNNSTRSLKRCPRITQDYDIYPYEIELGSRSGRFADIILPPRNSEDPEEARVFIEQHRMEDLDGDGLAEPYIITVDVETRRTMRVEAAFTSDDVVVDDLKDRVKRIDRYVPFPTFTFLPSPRGLFYGMGLAKLLDSITDSVDTTLNQLIDAGNAQIAGGGFIGSQVRLQGSGQGGAIWFRPGEYQTVAMAGNDIRAAIWERTVPQPSTVAFQMLELLLAAAKDIAAVKDVITGDTPATAPVGTTMALQDQALTVFSSIFKRIYRGFTEEVQLIYQCIKRYADDEMRRDYEELTGGDLDEDFKGDGTDIMPVADPNVVTKMQQIARVQSTIQLAESEVGQAAGMLAGPQAQEIAKECLDTMNWDRPERFIGQTPPNPLDQAKVAVDQAKATLLQAQAATEADAGTLDQAKATREIGLAELDTHELHKEGDRIARTGMISDPTEGGTNGPGREGGAPGGAGGAPSIGDSPTGAGDGAANPGTGGG